MAALLSEQNAAISAAAALISEQNAALSEQKSAQNAAAVDERGDATMMQTGKLPTTGENYETPRTARSGRRDYDLGSIY